MTVTLNFSLLAHRGPSGWACGTTAHATVATAAVGLLVVPQSHRAKLAKVGTLPWQLRLASSTVLLGSTMQCCAARHVHDRTFEDESIIGC